MKRFSLIALIAVLSVAIFAQNTPQAGSNDVNTALASIWGRQLVGKYSDSPEARAAYFDGLSRALQLDTSNPRDLGLKEGLDLRGALLNMRQMGLPLDEKALIEALRKVVIDRKAPVYSNDDAQKILEDYIRARQPEVPDSLDAKAEAQWVASKAALPGAKVLPSGVVVVTHEEGSGASPADTETARVRYTGRMSSGRVFDSTGEETIDIPLNRVIKGFAEGLRQMKAGGHYTIYIPSHLAYGKTGAGSGTIPPNASLEFEIHLIDIIK